MPDTNTVRQFISGHALPGFFLLLLFLAVWIFFPQKQRSLRDRDIEY